MTSRASTVDLRIEAQDAASAVFDKLNAKLQAMPGPLGAITSKLNAIGAHPGMRQATNAADSLGSKLGVVGLSATAGLAGFGFGMTKIVESVKKTAEEADRIGDLGGRLNLNAEQFQVFEKLAKDGGASIEEMGGAFTKFRLNLSQAESEGGAKLAKMQKALGTFGLSFNEARNMQPLELAKKLGQISAASGTEKDAELKIPAFRDLFGKTGATLIPIIESVGTSYDKTLEGMAKSGTLFTDKQVEASGRAYKSWQKAQGAMAGLNRVFGLAMAPAFERFAAVLYERAIANRNALLPTFQRLGESLSNAVVPFLNATESLIKSASYGIRIIAWLSDKIGGTTLALGALLVATSPMIYSFGLMAKGVWGLIGTPLLGWLAQTRLGLLATSIAANVAWSSLILPVGIAVAGLALVWTNLGTIGDYLSAMMKRIMDATSSLGLFGGAWQMVKEIVLGVINAVIGVANSVGELFKAMGLGKGFNIGLVGAPGQAQAAGPSAQPVQAAAPALPATTPYVANQQMQGTVRVQLDKGLIPAEVKSDNKNFNIDAMAGAMFMGA